MATTTTTTTTTTSTTTTTTQSTQTTRSTTTTTMETDFRHVRAAVGEDETTTKATTTTTPAVLNCYSCTQMDSSSTGDCWNPSETTEMEVCSNGCIAKMTQGFQTGSGFETSVERTCSRALLIIIKTPI